MYEAQRFFSRQATVWDQSGQHHPGKISAMLTLSDISPHSVVLDVGCGTGVLEPYLLAYRPAAILAVDFAPGMIAEANRKLVHNAVTFVCADLFDLGDMEADNCIVFNTFPHFPDPERALDHMAGLIRPGGRITISHTQGKRDTCGKRNLHSALEPAGVLRKMLERRYYVDAVVDNNAMLLVSALKKE